MRITGVVVDWAGTVVDHGCRAPVATLEEVFRAAGVPITSGEARISMGIAKKDHIKSILDLARVRDVWKTRYAAEPGAADLESLYARFVPKQLDCLVQYSEVIAGVPEMIESLRSRGIKIGSSTGYTRPMLDRLLAVAREQGFRPDAAFCPDDVSGGRPAPWMCYRNAIGMGVYPMWTMVKIGDTPSDIAEGLNAGMWTIGITRTGNEIGLTSEEWEALPETERARLLEQAKERLLAAGAHHVAPSVAECGEYIEMIQSALASGRRPLSDAPVE